MQVTTVAITSNVATVGVKILEGIIPVVTSKVSAPTISIQGTKTTTSGGAPNFNVTNAVLTGVTIDSTTGIGTVTFALTSSDIATTNDAGGAISPTPTKFEVTAPTSGTAGLQFAIGRPYGVYPGLAYIAAEVVFSGTPGTFECDIQTAETDVDAAYTNALSITSVTSLYANADIQTAENFIRAYMKTLTNAVSAYVKFTLQ